MGAIRMDPVPPCLTFDLKIEAAGVSETLVLNRHGVHNADVRNSECCGS
jgi:hypothetical protein